MTGVRCTRLWTIWQNLVSSKEQILVEHLFQCPPARFDVIVVQCHIRIIQINPECHTFSHLSPGLLIGPDTIAAFFVKFGHTECFNRFITHQIEALLNLNFNWQPMGVPPTFSLDEVTLHSLPSTN